MEDAVLLTRVQSILFSLLDVLRKLMEIVLTVLMDLEGKVGNVKLGLRNACNITKMVHANCAILSTH